MIDFAHPDTASFHFYRGKKVLLEDANSFGVVAESYGNVSAGYEIVKGRKLIAFVFPGKPGWIANGELLELFIPLATEACEQGYRQSWRYDLRFVPIGERSIGLLTKEFGGETVTRMCPLPDSLLDFREWLIAMLNEALDLTQKGLC